MQLVPLVVIAKCQKVTPVLKINFFILNLFWPPPPKKDSHRGRRFEGDKRVETQLELRAPTPELRVLHDRRIAVHAKVEKGELSER